jgi:hypothetical protein
MQDYVTLETARKLKDAGFPQPEKLQFGDVFYPYIMLSRVRGIYSDEPGIYTKIKSSDFFTQDVFAPRSTDILKQIDGIAVITFFYEDGLFYGVFPPDYMPIYFPEIDVSKANYQHFGIIKHENPAECAAQIWFKVNQK